MIGARAENYCDLERDESEEKDLKGRTKSNDLSAL
jgi:hypothetical protein